MMILVDFDIHNMILVNVDIRNRTYIIDYRQYIKHV